MAEHRERYLQSPADGHFTRSSIPKTYLLLKTYSQKRMELRFKLRSSWYLKPDSFYLIIILSYLMF